MSYQASAWYQHTLHYLAGIDAPLADMFVRAMKRAGFPSVGEAAALEAILADFLAGFDRVEPEICNWCGSRMDQGGDHILCVARPWRPTREAPP